MRDDLPVVRPNVIGRNIKRYMREDHLTAGDLQDAFGFEYPQAIYNWISGKNPPSLDNLYGLSKILGTSMESILSDDDEMLSHHFEEILSNGFLLAG